MSARIYEQLLSVRQAQGAGFVVLIDPDKLPLQRLPHFAAQCAWAGVDAFFVGGSLLHTTAFERYVTALKATTSLPVVGFPGSVMQLCGTLDAVLYLSVISGRNPEYLFGQHVVAAPLIKSLGLEAISTGYMLVESGHLTTAQYMSHSLPLPRKKPEVAAATALAAEMMGMRLLYTDGGSGAEHAVPDELISAIDETCSIPLVVGGGLATPAHIAAKVSAGADFIVVGTAAEKHPDRHYLAEMVAAAHRVDVPME